MTRTATVIILCSVLTALVSACADDGFNDRLANATVDVMIAREMGQDTVAAQQRARAALQKHGYTVEQYEQEYREVASSGDRYRDFSDTVQARLAVRQSAAKNR